MPINVAQGNILEFILEFTDASGNPSPATGAVLTVSYTSLSLASTAASVIRLTQADMIGFMHRAFWSSSDAALGFAQYSLSFGGAIIPVADPNLRINSPSVIL